MAWKLNVGESSMLLDDFTAEELATISASRDENGLPKYPEMNWLKLYNSPASNPGAFYDLVCLAARKLSLASPDRPANVKEMAQFIVKSVDQVDDDLPTSFTEDGIPLGEAVVPATTTSSGSSE